MEPDLDSLVELCIQNLLNFSGTGPDLSYNNARALMERLEEIERAEQTRAAPETPLDEAENKLEITSLPKLTNLQLIHEDCSDTIYEQFISSPAPQIFHRVDKLPVKHVIRSIHFSFLTNEDSHGLTEQDK
jgi:hypothetical protein